MSAEKRRQQAGWWVPAFIGFILALIIGIRYISSQGGWGNPFDPIQRDYKPITAGVSVQAPNQSEVSVGVQPLNPGRPAQPLNSTDSDLNSRDSDPGRRALW
jgi:hypothetical protein